MGRNLSKAIALPSGRRQGLPFADFRDDHLLALICPTCQTASQNARSIMPALFYFAWGCFSDFDAHSRIGSQTFAAKIFLFAKFRICGITISIHRKGGRTPSRTRIELRWTRAASVRM
jgi:hypothetical protein